MIVIVVQLLGKSGNIKGLMEKVMDLMLKIKRSHGTGRKVSYKLHILVGDSRWVAP